MIERLGPYEIVGLLGRGAAATVYRAREISTGRVVALKVLGEDLMEDEVSVRRFRREARVVGLLDHPNIVELYDVGSEDDRLYIAMELVEGQTLENRLEKEGPLEEAEAFGIVLDIARALEHAHGRGLIHRDIKPANILLGENGVVKIADMELTKCVGGGDSVTRVGDAMGTPYYIAPEQIEDGPVDGRCDIYALGCTFYHMVTGVPPFHDETNPVLILTKRLEEDPEPVGVLAPRLSKRAIRLLESMMRRSPEKRIASAKALRVGVEEALFGPRSRIAGGRAPVRRSGPLTLPVALGLLLFAGLVVYLVCRWIDSGSENLAFEDPAFEDPDTVVAREPTPLHTGTTLTGGEKEVPVSGPLTPQNDPPDADLPETTALDMVRQQARELLEQERLGSLRALTGRIERQSWDRSDEEAAQQLVADCQRRMVAVQRDLFGRIEAARSTGDEDAAAALCRRVLTQGDDLASHRARQILAVLEGRVERVKDSPEQGGGGTRKGRSR